MRKKIPTITRPDPAYAASLRPEGEKDPGREGADPEDTVLMPMSMTADVADEGQAPVPSRLSVPSQQSGLEAAADAVAAPTASPPRVRRIPATRKIDIRVNALERQEEALIDCGVDPAHVIRAALRRAVKTWQLGPEFVPPSDEQRTRITEWRARTSLAVDANALRALLRAHDPLDVLSKWALIRGQLEPFVWAEIDVLLDEIAQRIAEPQEAPDEPIA
ncbi:hypothetical protein [Pseudosulfitobacter sp. DSM 107133]|uniref:hypothetical protein n=1 Tax=Pseudosulfitobacter sp. DSM 107133 TaxID=2883100 RepID=UPI000DF43142|nr:hypothetical protein [Pseudosulfitobacter sp. DSM 107133]UOA29965.1 hypothetical protein DSM107133_04728 [Pseudosulfitobacter sp. DSM 107133]